MTTVEKVRKPRKSSAKKIEQIEVVQKTEPVDEHSNSKQNDIDKAYEFAMIRTIVGFVLVVLFFAIIMMK